MKKILIISYFFPPCSLTAAQRPLFWVKYLKDFGYYPIVVTRRWDHAIKKPEDVLKATGTEMIHEKKDGYEVYYMPYKASLRDKLFTKFSGTPFAFFSKPITLSYLIFQNFSLSFIPFRNLYDKAKELLEKDKELNKFVITGNPFEQYFFGYLLHKITGVSWLADYRDDWTTTELKRPNTFLEKLVHSLEEKSEKKWVGTAQKITSVSQHYVNKISNLVNRPGEVLLNGYEKLVETNQKEQFPVFSIVYNGTLYPSQKIEPFLAAVINVATKLGKDKIHVYFPGLAFDESQANRVKIVIEGFESCFTITPRIPKAEVLAIQEQAQLMLMVPHEGIKGIPSSKLFEYLGLQKPVLLIPNDEDVIEEILSDCGLGYIANDTKEAEVILLKLIEDFYQGKYTPLQPAEQLKNYSRYEQTKKLAQVLDSF